MPLQRQAAEQQVSERRLRFTPWACLWLCGLAKVINLSALHCPHLLDGVIYTTPGHNVKVRFEWHHAYKACPVPEAASLPPMKIAVIAAVLLLSPPAEPQAHLRERAH